MKEAKLKFLICPKCGNSLNYQHSFDPETESEVELLNCTCGKAYPIIENVPRFYLQQEDKTQKTSSLNSFNFQYGKEAWIFGYDVERVKRILKNVFKIETKDFEAKSVCVIGCGNGAEVYVISSLSPEIVVGMDLTDSIQDAARNNEDNANVIIVQADALNPPVKAEYFDVLYCDGVLPHTQNPRKFLAGIVSLIKPGGDGYIRTLVDHGDSKSRLYVLPRNIIRKVTKRLPSNVWWKLCYLIALSIKVPLLGWVMKKFFFYEDRFDKSLKVTQLMNFRFYGDHKYRHRLPKAELEQIISENLPGSNVDFEGSSIRIKRTAPVTI